MAKVTETQLVLLSKAAAHDDGALVVPAKMQKAGAAKAAASLINRGLMRETRAKSDALLLGKLFNGAGERMTPGYAVKQGVRYRYYVSVSAVQSREQLRQFIHRVPAAPIEAIVVEALAAARRVSGLAGGEEATFNPAAAAPGMMSRAEACNSGVEIERASYDLVEGDLERVTVHADRIEILHREKRDEDGAPQRLTVPWSKPSQTRRREILQPESSDGAAHRLGADERMRLLRATALARLWLDQLIAGVVPDVAALAAREGKTGRWARMTLSSAFLDPALIQAAAQGRLPRGYGVSRLVDLPPRFEDQWRALGLARPA